MKQNKSVFTVNMACILMTCVILTNILISGMIFLDIDPAYADENVAGTTVPANATNVAEIWPAGPDIFGASAILMEAETGAIIYMKDATAKRYPASITKIVTAVLAIEYGKTEDKVVFSDNAINSLPYDAAKVGIVPGEEVMLTDCLYALILRSGNEVANGLAEYVVDIVKDTEDRDVPFAELMNDFAKRAGAVNTNFANSNGLHDDNHYTTAYDMAMITKEAIKNQTFCNVWGTGSYTLPPTNKKTDSLDIWNRHSMLVKTRAEYYEYAVGGKTGYTGEAGNTLVTYAKKDDMSLICVVMRSDNRIYNDTKALLEYGFNNFKKVNVAQNDGRFSEDGGRLTNIIKPGAYDSVVIPVNADIESFDIKIEYSQDIAGNTGSAGNNIAGEIQYVYGDYYLGKADLIFDRSSESNNYATSPAEPETGNENRTDDIVEKDIIIINIKYVIAILAAILAIALLIIFFRMTGTKKSRRRRYR